MWRHGGGALVEIESEVEMGLFTLYYYYFQNVNTFDFTQFQ